MKKQLGSQISVNPTSNDLTVIQEIATAERRKGTDVIRNILEDVLDGKITIEVPEDYKAKRQPTAVRVAEDFKERFDSFKDEKNLSADKILHLAVQSMKQNFTLQTLNNEASTDDITEHLIQQQIEAARKSVPVTQEEREAAMRALMGKHRHSNSPRHVGLGNKEVDVA